MSALDTPLGGRGGAARGLGFAPRTAALLAHYDAASGSGSYTATRAATIIIRAWGGGGSGSRSNTAQASGAGGGAVGYKVLRLSAGQTVSWSIGAGGASTSADDTNGSDGGDTTITIPGGFVLTAGGGKKGLFAAGLASATGGLGGQPSGSWDLARSGAPGGDSTSVAGTAGGSTTGGGSGGAPSSRYGGGGGAAGFSDLFPGIVSGDGGTGNSGSGGSPGSGSGGAAGASGAGGAGRVIITVVDLG